jgi:hypothetical protein
MSKGLTRGVNEEYYLKTVAWVGVLFLFIGAIISFYSSWQLMMANMGETEVSVSI